MKKTPQRPKIASALEAIEPRRREIAKRGHQLVTPGGRDRSAIRPKPDRREGVATPDEPAFVSTPPPKAIAASQTASPPVQDTPTVTSPVDEDVPVQAESLIGSPNTETSKLLTLTEAARRLGKHRSTVSRWVRDDLIPSGRFPSGSPAIAESVVQRLVDKFPVT